MSIRSHFKVSLVAAAALATLAACDKGAQEQRSVGQKLDSAITSAERKAEVARNEVKGEVSDASITARINADLVADPTLSALRINVDTQRGRVSLRGTAPNAAARERAAQIAANVKGVSGVDNQLVVSASS